MHFSPKLPHEVWKDERAAVARRQASETPAWLETAADVGAKIGGHVLAATLGALGAAVLFWFGL